MTKQVLTLLLILAVPSVGMAFSVGTETIEDYGAYASGFNNISTDESGISQPSSTPSPDFDETGIVEGGHDGSGHLSSVPEPSALILMGFGLVAAGTWRRLRK